MHVNSSSVNPTKWSNTLEQFVGKLPKNCLSVFDHFVELAVKVLANLRVRGYKGYMHFSYLQITNKFQHLDQNNNNSNNKNKTTIITII